MRIEGHAGPIHYTEKGTSKRSRDYGSQGVALAALGVVVLIINPLINALLNVEPRDMSRFSYLSGSLPNLIIQLLVIWSTAAFLEEFLYR